MYVAVCPSAPGRARTGAAQYVLFQRDWFQMPRVQTGTHPAKMIQRQSLRNGTSVDLVACAVSQNHTILRLAPRAAISSLNKCPSPEPTTRGVRELLRLKFKALS